MTNEEFLVHFGAAIRNYRIMSGLSQEKLGEIIQYDKNTIGKIERGESNPKITTFYSIAQGLQTSCRRILKDAEQNEYDQYTHSIEYDYLRLFEYCRRMTPEQFNCVCNIAHMLAEKNTTD
ncbi:MAG: helix-turn-helix transcriptional regulator [Eubacterium sp.]|nr:helix-turn-helix transcriptional regulator [Eubacterium sp.]